MRSGSPGAVQPSGGGYGKRNAVGTRGSPGGIPGLGGVPPWVLVPGWRGRSGGRGRARRGAPPAARPPRFSPGLRLSGRGWSRGRSQPCPACRSHTAAPPPGSPNPSCPRRGSPGPAPGGIQPAGPGVRPGTRAGEPRGLRGLGNWWWAKHREVGTAGSPRREVVKCLKGGWEVSVFLRGSANAEG